MKLASYPSRLFLIARQAHHWSIEALGETKRFAKFEAPPLLKEKEEEINANE